MIVARLLALPVPLLLMLPSAAQLSTTVSAEDLRIFEAVLQHTVRTFVVSFSNRMDSPGSILVLDRTIALCPAEAVSASCLDRERFESSAQSNPALQPDLVAAFRTRNADPVPVPGNLAPDLVSIPHDAVQEALREWREKAYGYLAFSRPGYASERAVVWVSYVCDGCGRGWLFTLHQAQGAWIVDDVHRTLQAP